MTTTDNNGLKNVGDFSARGDSQAGIGLSLYQDIGAVASPLIFGAEGEASYEHSFSPDTDYFLLLPLSAYIDIAFTGKERSVYNNRNGLKLFGGALGIASNYGYLFPFFGAGADLYLGMEQSKEKVAVFGLLQVQGGRLGTLNVGSKNADKYPTVYDDVNIVAGLAKLGLNFYEVADVAAEGLVGKIMKKEGYHGDWGDEVFEGPDVYDMLYGVSLQFQLGISLFSLSLAYYYLNCKGGGYYADLEKFFGLDIDDSTTKARHTLGGKASLRLVDKNKLKLDLGVRGNLSLGNRQSKITVRDLGDIGSSLDTDYPATWNNNRSYFNGYLALAWNWFFIEIGGGYMKRDSNYHLSCDPFCNSPEGNSSNSNWNVYLNTKFKWGGPKKL